MGLDAIGRELLIQLQPFGVRLAGMGRRPRSEMDAAVVALLDEYRPLSEFHSTLAATGLLVVCLPLTAGTRGIIRAAEFQALRPGAILVNVGAGHWWTRCAGRGASLGPPGRSRPGCLLAGTHRSRRSVLAENVSATPHVGGVTTQAYRATAQRFAANVERLRHGEPLESTVA